MDKLDKVIKGLECCQIGCDMDCPYWTSPLGSTSICRSEMERDALAMLKAQEQEVVNLTTKIVELTTSQKARPDCAGANHDAGGQHDAY